MEESQDEMPCPSIKILKKILAENLKKVFFCSVKNLKKV